MPKQSAGLLLYRGSAARLEVFIVHPGGPFWKNKDEGSWSIPKGEYEPDDDPVGVALREFEEEVGSAPPVSAQELKDLGAVKQPSRKLLQVWAAEGDVDAENIRSNTFELEWPPRSGTKQQFPEVDRAGWFALHAAAQKLLPGQVEYLSRLATHLGVSFDASNTNADEGPLED